MLVMGMGRAGKSSIVQVLFRKLPAHETLFLEPTLGLPEGAGPDIEIVANTPWLQFEVWDLPGGASLAGT